MTETATEQTATVEAEKPTIVEPTSITIANPYSLLQMALEKNLDAERIGQFMDLQDRMEKKRAEQEYAAAMNNCQKKMPIVVRDKKNDSTGSMYARLESVANAIKPIYTEEGFTLEFGEEDSRLENHRRISCEVQHIGGHSKRFHLDSPIDDVGAKGTPNKTKIQGLGSLVSYLRRYLTMMVFNITVGDEDTDGNAENAKWNEEQCETIRKMAADLELAGVPFSEYRFIKYLASSQKDVDSVHVYEDVQQRFFGKAVRALDEKYKKAMADKASSGSESAKGVADKKPGQEVKA